MVLTGIGAAKHFVGSAPAVSRTTAEGTVGEFDSGSVTRLSLLTTERKAPSLEVVFTTTLS